VKLLPAGSVPQPLAELYHYAWFVGFAVAFVVYLVGRRLSMK
jgi:cytosine/uracil/thiamine/allantoin permease